MTRAGRLTRSEVAKLPVGSEPELLLSVQLEQAGIPFEREFRFSERKFRADFAVGKRRAYITAMSSGPAVGATEPLLIEVEGGAWVNGRHSRGAGMEADCEKSALAAIRGYRVMRVTPAQVNDGRALSWIRQALGLEKAA